MADLWATTDRFGRTVRMTEEGWTHIVLERQQTVPLPEAIRVAVESPDVVTADAEIAHRLCYYRERQDGGYLKVVVHYRPVPPRGAWTGVVITAYPCQRVKRAEQQRWP